MAKTFGKIEIPVAEASFGGALQGFIWDRVVRGEKINFASDVVTVIGEDASVQPDFSELIAIVQAGGKFSGIRLAIEFTNSAAAQQNVPVEVEGHSSTDEEDVEQQRTWVDWFRANSSTQVITNGTLYVAKAAFNGRLLNSVELAAIHGQAGIKAIEWADAQARYADEAYTVFEL